VTNPQQMAKLRVTRPPTNRPAVSVIVPTRDRAHMLREALASLQRQSFTDWECIVVDDASLSPISVPEDPRFRLIRHETASGPSGARNAAIRVARGAYIALLDDDDAYDPDALSHLVGEASPGLMVFGRYTFVGSDGAPAPQHPWAGNPGGEILRDPPPHWVGLYPRESIQWYDETFRTGEDIEWLFRMAQTHEVTTISHTVIYHRRHPEKRTGVEATTHLSGRLRLIQKHQEWFDDHPASYSHQLTRCAAAAYLAGEYATGMQSAVQSLRLQFSTIGLKLAVKCVLRQARMGWPHPEKGRSAP